MNPTLPALIFPAISLLFLAYTNRFLGLTSVARGMLREHLAHPAPHWEVQLVNIRRRLHLIRRMQMLGVASCILAALSMGALSHNFPIVGQVFFVGSLACFVSSLGICVHEIKLSIDAIEVEFRRAHVPMN
ncbi:DUF2721 domain-containing protein [Opitutus sp. ER46]|uniref:DUF2721 domain-containing protein n=1 Tax=Opitutus sp. ER46 TaxID=2161864 RepID=UPI000D3190C9|nr:DUF2721 domain-containing protein [Opitutus sp. ER46]PTX92735.1 DUF2721 domain-containing protein [Opitutus sp. ER46]